MMKDIHSGMLAAVALAAAALDADTAGATIDLQGYDGCEFVLSAGVGGITFDGTNYIEVIMEESDDDTTWSAVDDAYVLGMTGVTDGVIKTFGDAHAAGANYRFGYVGYKRYARIRLNFVGTHGSPTPLSAIALLRGMQNPQADQA